MSTTPAQSTRKRYASFLALACIAASSLHAASGTWTSTGNTSGLWSNTNNWLLGNVPGSTSGTTSTEVATFNSALGTYGTAGSPIVIDSGRNIGGITFDATPGSYNIGDLAGPSLTLSSGGSFLINSTATGSSTQTIRAPLVMVTGNYSIFTNTLNACVYNINGPVSASGAGTHTLTLGNIIPSNTGGGSSNFFNGAISNGSATTFNLAKTGLSFWTLTADNTYNGTTTVSAGVTNTGGQTGSLRLGGTNGRISATTSVLAHGLGTLANGDQTTPANNTGVTNRINPAATLTLGSASLGGGSYTQVAPPAGATHAQSLASLTLGTGYNTIAPVNATGTNTLSFTGNPGYIRNVGGVLNVTAAAGFTASFANAPAGAAVSGSGTDAILVGATLGTNSFVLAPAAGANLANANYTLSSAGNTTSWVAGKNMDVPLTDTAPSIPGDLSINSLRFNVAGNQTLTLGGVLNIASGGLMVGSAKNNATTTQTTITGGTITGSASGDLILPIYGTGGLVVNSVIANNGGSTALTKVGGGALTLNGNNTYTGDTYLNQGTITANATTALGSGTVRIQGHTAQLRVAPGVTIANNLVFNSSAGPGAGAGLLHVAAVGTGTVTGSINVNVSPTTGGVFATANSSCILDLKGPIYSPFNFTTRAGVVRLGGGGSYTRVSNNGATVQVGADNGICTTAEFDTSGGVANSVFDLFGFNQEIAGLLRTGSGIPNYVQNSVSGLKTLTINTPAGASYNCPDAVGGAAANTAFFPNLGITKKGAGTQILSGINTYTGPTAVEAGKLYVGITANSTAAISTGGSVAVSGGATLGGTGAINSPVSLASGATLEVGYNGQNSLTVGALSTAGNATIAFGLLNGAPSVLTVSTIDGLVLNGAANSVSLTGDISSLVPGTYKLIGYSGTLGGAGGFSALKANFTTGPRLSATLNNGSGQVELVVTGDTPKWTGALSPEWSTATLASPKNWQLANGLTPTDFFANDVVLFDDTATNTTVDISVANVSTQGTTFNNTSKDFVLQGSKGITGSAAIVKNGSGNLTISNPNAQTGGFTLNSGNVTLSGGGTLGAPTAPITLNAGALNLGGTTQNAAAVTLASSAVVTNGNLLGTSYTLNATTDFEVTAALGGPGATLVKTGGGNVTLSGANSYSGNTTVSAGRLKIGSSSSMPASGSVSLAAGTTLDLNSHDLTVANFTSSTADSYVTSSGDVAGTDTLTVPTSTVALQSLVTDGPNRKVKLVIGSNNADTGPTNANSTYSGGFVMLGQQNGNNNGTRLNPRVVNVDNGVVVNGPYGTGPITLGLAPTDKVQFYFDPTKTFIGMYNELIVNSGLGTDTAGVFRVEAASVEFYSRIVANKASATFRTNNVAGSATLFGQISTGEDPTAGLTVMASGATLTIALKNESADKPNNYTGNTTVTGAVLRLDAANQIPNGAGKGSLFMSGGVLDLNGFSETVNALAGTAGTIDNVSSGGSNTLTIGDGDASGSAAVVIKNTTGTLSLEKIGGGNQTFTGLHAYSGTTAISGGSLIIGRAAGSLPPTTPVTISNGATLDIGASTQTVASVTMSSGSINGTTGVLTAGSYSLGAGSVSAVLAGSGGVTKSVAGLLTLSGNNTYSGSTTVNAGTLRVDGNQTLATGAVGLAAGATLEGNGSVGGALTAASGAFVSPGVASTGTLTVANAQLASGSTLLADVQPAQVIQSDTLAVTGALDVTGSTLSISVVGTPTDSAYVLATYGTLTGTFGSTTGVPSGYTVDYAYNGNKIALVKTVVVTPYGSWAQTKGLTAGVNDAYTADPDGDGLNNLAEFALDSDPLNAANQGKIYGRVGSVGGASTFTVTLPVRNGATFSGSTEKVSAVVDGIIYHIQGSTNLSAWTEVVTEVTGSDATTIQTGLPALETGWTYRTFRTSGTTATAPRTFMRAVFE